MCRRVRVVFVTIGYVLREGSLCTEALESSAVSDGQQIISSSHGKRVKLGRRNDRDAWGSRSRESTLWWIDIILLGKCLPAHLSVGRSQRPSIKRRGSDLVHSDYWSLNMKHASLLLFTRMIDVLHLFLCCY